MASKSTPTFLFHIAAILAVAVWGTTFVSTKILIAHGLAPAEIFCYRFLLAYLCILFIAPRRWFSDSFIDELLLIAAGITGGSLYFITENTALGYTQASNVAMIISITPLLTTLLAMAVYKTERSKNPWRIITGAIIALAGVSIVIYNGNIVLKINPKGDMLTLTAAFSWAIYSLLIKNLGKRYSALFITRKVFAYGLLSLAVWLLWHPATFHFNRLIDWEVAGNLLFLGIVASMLCFSLWSSVVKRIGTVKATNYINLNPIITFISAYYILGERITAAALVGAAAIIAGVFIIEKR